LNPNGTEISNFMKKLMKKIMLSCEKATELIEKKIHFKLSLKEKVQLAMHLALCKPCSNYKKQSYLIEKTVPNIEFKEIAKEDLKPLKEEIIKKL